MPPTRRTVSFIAELRQRKVFRVAAAYLVVAWVAVQAASIALPAFDAPDWVLRVVILVFALGFPLLVLLSWAVQLTPAGLLYVSRSDAGGNGEVNLIDLDRGEARFKDAIESRVDEAGRRGS